MTNRTNSYLGLAKCHKISILNNQKQIKIATVIIAMLLGTPYMSHAQVLDDLDWSLAKEKHRISVYTRKVEGYQIKETKVETIVDLPIDVLYNVLIDFDHHDNWMVNFSKSELLTSPNTTSFIYYVEVGAPWPIMDRDLVIKGNLEHMSDSLIILSTNKVEGYKDERDKFVRIPMMRGEWRFEKINDRRTKVSNTAHGDPGGLIPSWVINIKLVDDPIKSIENFIAIAKASVIE